MRWLHPTVLLASSATASAQPPVVVGSSEPPRVAPPPVPVMGYRVVYTYGHTAPVRLPGFHPDYTAGFRQDRRYVPPMISPYLGYPRPRAGLTIVP